MPDIGEEMYPVPQHRLPARQSDLHRTLSWPSWTAPPPHPAIALTKCECKNREQERCGANPSRVCSHDGQFGLAPLTNRSRASARRSNVALNHVQCRGPRIQRRRSVVERRDGRLQLVDLGLVFLPRLSGSSPAPSQRHAHAGLQPGLPAPRPTHDRWRPASAGRPQHLPDRGGSRLGGFLRLRDDVAGIGLRLAKAPVIFTRRTIGIIDRMAPSPVLCVNIRRAVSARGVRQGGVLTLSASIAKSRTCRSCSLESARR
jgi:hypothetical protein